MLSCKSFTVVVVVVVSHGGVGAMRWLKKIIFTLICRILAAQCNAASDIMGKLAED